MMPEEPFSLPSNMRGTFLQVHHPNSNPNSNPVKKKRSLPGTPDPGAEVIALSPKSLMATNRFICEICKKGFQRDQNLQLHRRGHNLPWKLKKRTKQDMKKKVYVCPEESCVHHDPCRALGDLTGIKKHYSRKHGEKKWKCNKCSKKYAVQSDCKAHSKICGTREYKCDCGTLFSRRDSFMTHRAFCGALAEQGALRNDPLINSTQAARIPPQSLTGFHDHEFGGSGIPKPLMGQYFVDAEQYGQKLYHANYNSQLLHPFGVTSNYSNVYETFQTMNNFGSSPQAQWLNYRYPQPDQASFRSTANNLSLPASMTMSQLGGVLKQEEEENKGEYLMSHHSNQNQKLQGNGPTHMSSANHIGVGFSLNYDSSSFGNLDHMVMAVDEEQLGCLTRDFLGVGAHETLISRPFLQQHLAKFNPI